MGEYSLEKSPSSSASRRLTSFSSTAGASTRIGELEELFAVTRSAVYRVLDRYLAASQRPTVGVDRSRPTTDLILRRS